MLGGTRTSNYSGGTTIEGGTLVAAKNSAFGTGSVAVTAGGTWGLQGGISLSNGGSLAGIGADGRGGALENLSGSNAVSGNLQLTAAATIRATAGTLSLTGALATQGYALTLSTAAGAMIAISGSGITGESAVTKQGAGTLTLFDNPSYTGVTTVEAGTLQIEGANTGSRAIVQSGAILGGDGSLGGATVSSGGTLSPGNSPGLLTVSGDLTLSAGSTLVMEFAGLGLGQFDQLAVGGLFTAGGTLSLQLLGGYVPQAGDEFEILPGGGIDADNFADLQTNLGGGLSWDTSQLAPAGILRVIPEPGAAGLLALSGGMLLRRSRRAC